MVNQLPRWQRAVAVSIIIALCVGIGALVLAITAPSVRDFVVVAIAVACPLPALVWIVRGWQSLQIKRHHRAWGALTFSMAAMWIASVAWAIGQMLHRETAISFWVTAPLLVGYLFLWFGILLRAEHFSPEAFWRMALYCDLLIVTGAMAVITHHLSVLSLHHVATAADESRRVLAAALTLAFITVPLLVVLLSSAVSRHLHRPRSLLVMGICLVVGSHVCYAYLLTSAHSYLVPLCAAVGALGFLLYGVAALWEAAFLRQRKQSRAVDPFPTLMGHLLPLSLLLLAAALIIRYGNLEVATSLTPYTDRLLLGLIIGLMVLRQLVTFAGTRRLYTAMQRLYVEMARNAITDAVTGLANHRCFMDRLAREMRRAVRYRHSLALLFTDMDNFKKINDTYGHRVGDKALSAIADCLRQGVRDTDMVARYGGEEFVILLPETSLEQASTMAERLRASVENINISLGYRGTLRLTMSCGVSAYPDTASTLEELLATADRAMYRAKDSGRNRCCRAVALPAGERQKSAVL